MLLLPYPKGAASARGLVAWIIGLFLAASVTAAAAPADGTAYETVVRAKPTPPAESGFTTRVKLQDDPPGRELADVLRQVPGVAIRDLGAGQPKTLTLRGAEGHQIAVFLDGIRLSDAARGRVDLSLYDPAQLAAIRVDRSIAARGSSSVGSGGAVTLETPALRGPRRTRLSLGYGSWNTLAVRASQSDGVGNWRYWAGGSYHQSDGDFAYVDENGLPARRLNNDSRGAEGLLKVDYLGVSRWRLSLLESAGGVARGAPGMSQLPSLDARQSSTRHLVALRATRQQWLHDTGQLKLLLFQRYGGFRFNQPAAAPDQPPAPPPVHTRSDSIGVGGKADADWEPRSWLAIAASTELLGDFFFGAESGNPRRLSSESSASARLMVWSERIVVRPTLRLAYASGFSPAVAPAVGAILQPFAPAAPHWYAGLQLVGSVGRSYRWPTFEEMFLRVDGFGPNPQLRPEDAIDVDAGLRWTFSPWIQVEAAYFKRWIDNMIIVAPVSSFLVRPDNYQGARSEGVETSLNIEPGLGLQGTLSYTFTRTRFSDPPLRLPGHPPHHATARLSWDGARCSVPQTAQVAEHDGATPHAGMRLPRLLRGLTLWTSISAQTKVALDRFNNVKEEARLLLAAGASYRWRWLTITAEGRNLLDKRDAVDTVGFPLPPASFYSGLTASF